MLMRTKIGKRGRTNKYDSIKGLTADFSEIGGRPCEGINYEGSVTCEDGCMREHTTEGIHILSSDLVRLIVFLKI